MSVFKLKATVYIERDTGNDASMELHDILAHAVKNYDAFKSYHVDSCEVLAYEEDEDDDEA